MNTIEKNNNAELKYLRGPYKTEPSFKINKQVINSGYANLAVKIKSKISQGLRVLVIDGYTGTEWTVFKSELDFDLQKINVEAEWINVESAYASEEDVEKRCEPFLGGGDRIFGTHYPGSPEIYFDIKALADLRIKAAVRRGDKAGRLTIIYGTGAGLTELWDQLWYIDVAKDNSQMKAREGSIFNVASNKKVAFEEFYKRSYFIDWPALNRLKKQLLPEMDVLIDLNDSEKPVFIDGREFLNTLEEITNSPFRVRPWFFPGPWGGKFMQGHMGLNPEEKNFAWSFETIVPENSVAISDEINQMEFSFDFLMFKNHTNILGEAAGQFKYEWPIRLDYLDTIDGGNLSTQVHPRPDYIKNNFGETYTQDETYYISKSTGDSQVYIGLTEECDPEEFKSELLKSQAEGTEVDIDRFVNSEPSKEHDLFLIPNGTVHCSGQGNLVLEISATPYIFTFKIYDYLRRDLEGNLRPINIKRGFENINFKRRKKYVQENLIAKPKVLEENQNYKLEELYNKPYTFYNINRAEFKTEYLLDTNGTTAYAINLVEGEQVELRSENGRLEELNYLESFIIPAAAGKVRVVNKTDALCKLVVVFIRPGIGTQLPVNEKWENIQ